MTFPKPQPWQAMLALFAVVSLIETLSVSHLLAFAPLYLQQLGAEPWEVPFWTGLISSGAFLLGLPLVPFWGVWADQFGRKLIIARSAFVEALVLALVGVSRSPLELAGASLLSGFQLGNTGVMYAALTAVTPRERLGFALSVVGAASPLGFALGPALGGPLADLVGFRPLYLADAALSVASGLAVALLFREAPRPKGSQGSTWRQAWEAVSGIGRVPAVALVFLAYWLSLLGRQMSGPFLPLLVQELYPGPNQATAVGLVSGGAALAGALAAPGAGTLGDRLGFARVLGWSTLVAAAASLGLAAASSLAAASAAALLLGAAGASIGAMCTALLATRTPEERRSPTLNLALLPLYFGGILGPPLGALLAALGLRMVFAGAALPFMLAGGLTRRLRR